MKFLNAVVFPVPVSLIINKQSWDKLLSKRNVPSLDGSR